ncbi:Inner membrane protein YecN [Thalassovita autumnalis]|uniref:Inner membrane protein YecN n=1 Tax=Thalassovita autumnalis TaxID=2072972 RepID=A0A0P1FV23_9RHOB|nr:MAPEG family protein [Thalassovita autumnalis]CUH63722.1 Inner membrane protein YecN [Thalassovita autumnalis]CUH72656.1 Inner membrane protein YecN [Thalassovita autumnalis]
MPLAATPLYAGLAALLFLYLSVRVIGTRRSEKVSVGDGANKAMIKAMRTHSNCAEYAPISLLLLLLVELQGAPTWAVHVLGVMFLAGRLLHAIGFGRTPQIIPLRKSGMILTFAMMALSALGLIAHSLI